MKNIDKSNMLWVVSLIAFFFETFRQFMSYAVVFRSYIYFLLWIVLCFGLVKRFVRKINYAPFFIFLLIVSIYIFNGGDFNNLDSVSRCISLSVGYMIIPTIFLFYNRFCTNKQISICLLVVFITTTYTLLRTIPVAMLQPGLIRETAFNEELSLSLRSQGVMNYALPHSVIFILPGLCYGVKNSQSPKIKIACIVAIVETFAILYFGEATTPLLLGLASFFISILYNSRKSVRTNLIRTALILVFLAVIMNESIIGSILGSLESVFEGTAFAEKIQEFEMTMRYGEVTGADMEARQNLGNQTINAIFENPILGTTNSRDLGHHNYFLDIFASIGIVGFFPLMAWLIYIVKKINDVLPTKTRFYYIVGVATFILHGFTKNVWGSEFFLYSMFLLPCLLLFLHNSINSQSCNVWKRTPKY